MDSVDRYVGQTFDEKYRLERLLGQGGMGAVYLATHLGTGRSVAVKLITPALMRRPVFVERFKREARAAGRLRHPNIVDVTDFGFARTGGESVAYLVMEYLDGCTLSDVLVEERILPLPWVVDILEQVCSAVHEAHRQGIVHRDLKPDNIWLEPNSLGGYRVKVLDFGIAKVAEGQIPGSVDLAVDFSDDPAGPARDPETIRLESATTGTSGPEEPTVLVEGAEAEADPARQTEGAPFDAADAGLTHGGALVGTPRFMSPEQCRGEPLDARSDIYSLGVIAYQMLAGTTPFSGDAVSVMRAQVEDQSVPLRQQNRRLPARVAALIMSALAKDPAARPSSALAFANALRANATGLGALYRRAFALYCEHFPKVLLLSLVAHVPVIAAVLITIGAMLAETQINALGLAGAAALRVSIAVMYILASFVAASTIAGVTAILVIQLEVAPLKQVELRAAFAILRRRWRPFLKTGLIATLRVLAGLILLVIPGLVMAARYLFWAPVVLMEGLEGKPARARSRTLVSRSRPAVIVALLFLWTVPELAQELAGRLMGLEALPKAGVAARVLAKLAPLTSIFFLPLVSIVPALLYLKMRQLGGETLTEIQAQLETGSARSRWEQRMRVRLITHTPPKPN